MLSSRVRLGYDLGDRGPVEALEPLVPLQVFHVAANGALPQKRLGLVSCDVFLLEQSLQSPRFHRPDFSNGERLLQEPKVRERGHEADPLPLQVLCQPLEVEPGFEVVHPGLEYALSVQPNPKPNGAERLLPFAESGMRKVNLCLLSPEVYVGKYDDVADPVLEYLRPPAGLFASVVLLPARVPHLLEYPNHFCKVVSRGAIGVVVVVAPS